MSIFVYHNSKKKEPVYGFTLVELSIVILIISVVVGSSIAGKSIIESAKLRGAMQQISVYKTATNLFQDKYKALPGDYKKPSGKWVPAGSSNDIPGDGNGKIMHNALVGAFLLTEALLFWKHLYWSKFITMNYNASGGMVNDNGIVFGQFNDSFKLIPDSYASTGGGGGCRFSNGDPCIGTPGAPISKGFQKGGFFTVYKNIYSTAGNALTFVSSDTKRRFDIPQGGVLRPKAAFEFDKKMDDGTADSGLIYISNSKSSGSCVNPNMSLKLDSKAEECYLLYWLNKE